MSYIQENEKIWDERSNNDDIWSVPVTTEIINNAKNGEVSILLFIFGQMVILMM